MLAPNLNANGLSANELTQLLHMVLASQMQSGGHHLTTALLDFGAKCIAVVAVLITTNIVLLNIARDAYERDSLPVCRPTLLDGDQWVHEEKLMSSHAARLRIDLDAFTGLIRTISRALAIFVLVCILLLWGINLLNSLGVDAISASTQPIVSYVTLNLEEIGDDILIALILVVMELVVWYVPDMSHNLLLARKNYRENKPPITDPSALGS